jgi:hypothetical protein
LQIDADCDNDGSKEPTQLSHRFYYSCTNCLNLQRKELGKHHNQNCVRNCLIIISLLPIKRHIPIIIKDPIWLSWRGFMKNKKPKNDITLYVTINPFCLGNLVIVNSSLLYNYARLEMQETIWVHLKSCSSHRSIQFNLKHN